MEYGTMVWVWIEGEWKTGRCLWRDANGGVIHGLGHMPNKYIRGRTTLRDRSDKPTEPPSDDNSSGDD